jgi:2-polyprenyl-6-methoxyphenol hydroxylase-like FAD-dependent oxidoreductase
MATASVDGNGAATAAERADVVIVGARCAGSAAAAMLTAAGRRVVVIDRTRFPADTLSTHAMFPSGCAEFQRIGAWTRIREEIRPAELEHVRLTLEDGTEARERWERVDGIDFGVSIPRDLLDVVLVENARERAPTCASAARCRRFSGDTAVSSASATATATAGLTRSSRTS